MELQSGPLDSRIGVSYFCTIPKQLLHDFLLILSPPNLHSSNLSECLYGKDSVGRIYYLGDLTSQTTDYTDFH